MLADLSVGVVSVGDVLLNNLKQHIEAAGITVEFRLTSSGGVLVCGSQVSECILSSYASYHTKLSSSVLSHSLLCQDIYQLSCYTTT